MNSSSMSDTSLATVLAGVSLKKTTTKCGQRDEATTTTTTKNQISTGEQHHQQSLRDALALEREQNARLRSVDLEAWYNEEMASFTFPTVFVAISQEEARAMVAGYWSRKQQQQQHGEQEASTTSLPSKKKHDLTEGQSALLSELEKKIAEGIESLRKDSSSSSSFRGVFAKMSSRSPKDSRMCEARAYEAVVARLSSIQEQRKKRQHFFLSIVSHLWAMNSSLSLLQVW